MKKKKKKKKKKLCEAAKSSDADHYPSPSLKHSSQSCERFITCLIKVSVHLKIINIVVRSR